MAMVDVDGSSLLADSYAKSVVDPEAVAQSVDGWLKGF